MSTIYKKSNNILEIILDDGSYVIYNLHDRREIYLGAKEYKIYSSLDGDRDSKELSMLDGIEFSEKEIDQLLQLFVVHHLIDKSKSKKNKWKLVKYIPFYKMKGTPYVGEDKITYIAFLILSLFFISVISFFIFINDRAVLLNTINQFEALSFIVIAPLFFIYSFLHEIGHSTAAILVNVPVAEIGIKFFLFFPLGMYTTILGLKKDKIGVKSFLVSSGGVIMNVIIAGVFLISTFFIKDIHPFISATIFINIFLVAINVIVLYPFDGFMMMKSLLGSISMSKIKWDSNMIKLISSLLLLLLICLTMRYSNDIKYITLVYIGMVIFIYILSIYKKFNSKIIKRLCVYLDFFYFSPMIYKFVYKFNPHTLSYMMKFLVKIFLFLSGMSIILLLSATIRQICFIVLYDLKKWSRRGRGYGSSIDSRKFK